ncbi:SusC/RagA family TonB-linked outer membrane protein [Belliella marina]|uniref:SusC/RagA family TonB-linked outer membrane protein n=1 Tax=Belliella marina TaxID=1644146 RepID=A0ABW4VLE7_9BACT
MSENIEVKMQNDRLITGTVNDQAGQPLPGANVVVKGTSIGTVTDLEGKYVLNLSNNAKILVFSYIGYKAQEVPINNKSIIDAILEEDIASLEEAVVIGYGTTSKRFNTGSVSSIKAETIEKQTVGNVLTALTGRATGLDITQESGIPGSAVTVRIRGQNSLNPGANEPLYIIDGIPFLPNSTYLIQTGRPQAGGNSPFSALNPNDIESIEVLKDADATAIFGSRGGNGVILITTKKGKSGKTNVDVNLSSGVGKITRKLDVLDRRDYLDMRYEAFRNDGIDWTAPGVPNAFDLTEYDTTRTTDWQDVLIGNTAHYTNAQVTASGGKDGTYFSVSGGYWKESTVFPGNLADQKISGRFSINHSPTNERLSIQLSGIYLFNNNRILGSDLTQNAISLAPVAPPIYTEDGRLNWANNTWANPLGAVSATPFTGKTNNMNFNTTISYRLFDEFRLKITAGYNRIGYSSTYRNPESIQNPFYFQGPSSRITEFSNNLTETWNVEPMVEYNNDIGLGKLSVLFGGTFQETEQQATVLYARGFLDDALMYDLQSATDVSTRSMQSIYLFSSAFARINYNISDKYLLNLTARRDGSSRFGPGKKFGNFGAVGAAWIFSEEAGINSALPFLSYGKIRFSHGITGSDAIGNYGFLPLYRTKSNFYQYYGPNGGGLYPNNLFNPDYQWESNRKTDVALELGLIENKILLTANYYINRSSNQLVGYPLPSMTGFTSIDANLAATVQNTGVELELSTIIIDNGSFTWSTNFNFTLPRNKLVEYPGLEGSSFANNYAIGHPLTLVKAYDYVGINSENGLAQYKKANGDTVSSIWSLSSAVDRTVLINVGKDYYGGLLNSFQYKRLQLDIFFQYAKSIGITHMFGHPIGVNVNQPQFLYDQRWTMVGDDANAVKATQSTSSEAYNSRLRNTDSNAYTDIFFIRLKNVALSYQLPSSIVNKINAENLRVYMQAQNLLTITDYLGMDPENQSGGLPPIASINLGIQLTF